MIALSAEELEVRIACLLLGFKDVLDALALLRERLEPRLETLSPDEFETHLRRALIDVDAQFAPRRAPRAAFETALAQTWGTQTILSLGKERYVPKKISRLTESAGIALSRVGDAEVDRRQTQDEEWPDWLANYLVLVRRRKDAAVSSRGSSSRQGGSHSG